MSKSPAAILYDADGHPVGVASDGSVYRLAVDANVMKWLDSTAPTVGQKGMASSLPVAIASDQTTLKVAFVTTDPLLFVSDYLKNGAAYDMKVNGSSTPQVYIYPADATKDIFIEELRFVFSAVSLEWSGAGFGKSASGGLTNGILVDCVINNGVTVQLGVLKVNEDFLRSFGGMPTVEQASPTSDVMVCAYIFSGETKPVLKAGTADKVRVTIRDNLVTPALGVNYLSATFFGNKVP